MKILMILENEFPPDKRVEKEIESLIAAGNEVDIACYTREGKPEEEEKTGYTIYRKPISKLMYKMSAASLVLPFYFKYWKTFIQKIFQNKKYDALHVHDLPLAKIGYFFKQKYGVKLICDQHEYYSNWISQTAHYNSGVGKIINHFSDWVKYEKKYLNKADLVITVEEPLRECYINDVNIPAEKIICVPNTSKKAVFNYDNVDPNIVDQYKDNFVLFYAGGITKLKNIDTAINALPEIIKAIPNIKLVVAAKISKYVQPLEYSKKLGVRDYIDYLGYIPHEQIPSYVAASDICFHVPPVYNEEVNRTIQTKLYQYILMNKPIIIGPAKMAREFITGNQIGLSIKENDARDFAQKVIELHNNQDLYHQFVENTKKLAKVHSWENTVQKLTDQYKKLEK